MEKNGILLSIITLLVGLIAGFFLANSINRSEINSMRVQPQASPASNTAATDDEPSLSAEEIRAKIDEADKNPTNFQYQKDLGIGLYRYGAMKHDVAILTDASRILARANSIDAKDVDVLSNLGNAYFDIGFAQKDAGGFEKARDFYNKALAIRPDDADVRTDLGISYYVQPQPDYSRSAAELQKVIDANPRHTRAIQYLAQVYIGQQKLADAEKLIAKLRSIDPKDEAIPKLSAQIERTRNPEK